MVERAMTVANDDTLEAMILAAQRRVILIAPGTSLRVALALVDSWRRLGPEAVTVTLDVSGEVCRLGLGEYQAVELLEKAAANLGTTLTRHEGLRIGVLISDDQTLIYSPTALSVEPPAREGKKLTPNAIRVGPPPEQLRREVGCGPEGVKERVIGLDKADKAVMNAVSEDLKKTPPRRVDLSRHLRVFSARLQFVELRLLGCMLHRKMITIPSDLVSPADESTRRLLQSKFRLIGDDEDSVWGDHIYRIKQFIVEKHLVAISGYGHVLPSHNTAAFERAIRVLRRMIERAKKRREHEIQVLIDARVHALHAVLLPGVERSPPTRWTLLFESPSQRLMRELRKLAGSARDVLDDARVELRYKGVTYETLHDQTFVNAVSAALPELGRLHDEMDVAGICG